MASHYLQAHVTAAPFTDASRSKAAPNSLVESLACGRPVLLTETVGLAEVVRESGAGKVSPATGEALAEHLDQLQAEWEQCSRKARHLAECRFGQENFLADYRVLYHEVLTPKAWWNGVPRKLGNRTTCGAGKPRRLAPKAAVKFD